MKHAYTVDCTCPRCMREAARRATQAARPHSAGCSCPQCYRPRRRSRKPSGSRRPVWGSAEWAETRGDDIPSYDVPGDY